MDRGFEAGTCDLCGSTEHEPLVEAPGARAMRSDHAVVDARLVKVACRRCGLGRTGAVSDAAAVATYYESEYTLGLREDHDFYGPDGPVSRSAAFADWLLSAAPAVWQDAGRILEVGVGSGHLLRALSARLPGRSFEGLEPGRDAVARARQAGFRVHSDLDGAASDPLDLIYSVAVIEHVPSPSAFLAALRSRLAARGHLILSQPTQDVPSYDVLFVDHLHHFGTEHLRAYARKSGFREIACRVGHPLMPNFSLHVWEATEPDGAFSWPGPPAPTATAEAGRRVLDDMARLDRTLERIAAARRTVAVFGVSEAYWLARSYSALADFPVACGLDDRPGRAEYGRLGFPVVPPEDAASRGVQDVLLTMNKIYYPLARDRVARLGLVAHPVFS